MSRRRHSLARGLAILVCALVACSGCGRRSATQAPADANPGDPHILVDQFGYRPQDTKVAVIRNPKYGYDRASPFVPGGKYEVRRVDDETPVFSGTLTPWRGGAVEPSSGDQGWWFDFSAVTAPGRYTVYDVERRRRSAPFRIDAEVYRKVLQAAMRMYFYQRSGFAKRIPFAAPCWTDAPAYLGPDQDREARDVTDPGNPAKRKDVSGGWFDAGDTGRYVTFAAQPVHQLLTAWQEHPRAFGDDFNLPESGNGIPDVLDEVKWEIDWLKRMQFPDGSVALKVGETAYGRASPPSESHTARFYVPACTSATIAAAGMYAHASYVFGTFVPLTFEADSLKMRALSAWRNYQSFGAQQLHCDTGSVKGGNADWNAEDQAAAAVVAAVYLSAITADPTYDNYVKAHYRETQPYRDVGWSRYKPEQGEALLFYTTLPRADATVKAAILRDKAGDARAGNQIYGFRPDDDLYRAFLHDAQYHWGSNMPRADYGNSNLDAATFAAAAGDPGSYRLRAEEILHYFHGVNPLGMTYLTNMYSYGATRSANEIFHTWYWPGTRWSDARTSECGPPPGYVPAGPNANAIASGVPARLAPPTGQPPQKSYLDWNGPEASWTITEPGIYYQSAYVKLLAAFVDTPPPEP